MSPLGQATFSSVLVVNVHSILATYQMGGHTTFAKSYGHHLKVPVAFSPHFKPKSDACPLFLQLCCFLRHITIPTVTAHTPLVHNSAPLSNHMRYSPTSNSKSLSRLYLLTASSSCVTSRSVHKSFDHTMHLREHEPKILS